MQRCRKKSNTPLPGVFQFFAATSRCLTIVSNLSPEGLNLSNPQKAGGKMSKSLLNPIGVQCEIAANIPPVTPMATEIKPLSGYLSAQIP